MALPIARQIFLLDTELPATGTIGYIALISPNTFTGNYTFNQSTDIFTTSVNHGLVTGSRIRLSVSGGTLPAPDSGIVNSITDYFCIKESNTTFKIARTLAEANSNTPITFSDAGSGTQTVTEQPLNASQNNPDPLSVVLNKELSSGGGYSSRIPMTDVGNASLLNGEVVKNISFILTGDVTGYTYRYYQLILGGSGTIGNTSGTQSFLIAENTNVLINSGSSRYVLLNPAFSSP